MVIISSNSRSGNSISFRSVEIGINSFSFRKQHEICTIVEGSKDCLRIMSRCRKAGIKPERQGLEPRPADKSWFSRTHESTNIKKRPGYFKEIYCEYRRKLVVSRDTGL